MAEKSEKATPKKLRDARKKGQIAKVQDFPSAVTFIVAVALTLGLSDFIFKQLSNFMLTCFRAMNQGTSLDNLVGSLILESFDVILMTSLPIAGIVAIIGCMTTFIINGPVFSMEAMKPSFKKLNPIDNLKQKFKMKTLIELLKSLLKITIAAILIYLVVKTSIAEVIQTASLPLYQTAVLYNSFLMKVVIHVGIFFILIAICDLIYQKQSFAKEMKMEKFEVKQEYKDTEGNPEIKGRRRHIAQEIAYDEGPSAVRRARAVVTNPNHVAVAIGYEPKKYAAPFILAKGLDLIAEAIIKEAEKWGIPIMRDVPLARTLFELGKVYSYIPAETYEAVAEVLRVIGTLEEEED